MNVQCEFHIDHKNVKHIIGSQINSILVAV